MEALLEQIQIRVNSKIFLKDPESSRLGKKIIKESIGFIDQAGLEQLTFRKLAHELETAESSVYRYFENKHKLLLYLTAFYWGWLEYWLVFSTANLDGPQERLKSALTTLIYPVREQNAYPHIDFEKLHRILVSESYKAYLTKSVEAEDKEGLYDGYRRICDRLSNYIIKINPQYPYPHSLSSSLVETILHQQYFSMHLTALTDVNKDTGELENFIHGMAFGTLNLQYNGGDQKPRP